MEIIIVIELLAARPSTYLDEIQKLLYNMTGTCVHNSTICRTMQYLGFCRKRLKRIEGYTRVYKCYFLVPIISESNFLLWNTTCSDNTVTGSWLDAWAPRTSTCILYPLACSQGLGSSIGTGSHQRCECVGSNPTQVLRFSFSEKKILGLVYKWYKNELLTS